MRHGRATMPWGKYRGLRIRLLPDDYLSWLTTSSIMMQGAQWGWLRESLLAELRFRGFNTEGIAIPDEEPPEEKLLERKRRIRVPDEQEKK